jgi:hypothetical protein
MKNSQTFSLNISEKERAREKKKRRTAARLLRIEGGNSLGSNNK